MADPLIGTTVGQYHVLAKLGGGGMGVVYKARDTKLGRLVALKFLPPQWSHDDEAKQRFVREAQAASATDHGNICTVHDIQTTHDGQLFIVMAYYGGQTLKQRLAAGPLSVEEALAIATQVADGLARAHAAGVVHRDIKPGNLILTEDAVKIVDFGLAKFADSLQLTQAGSPVGTVAYMSPEQLRGQDATAQSDVWAVGVILYEMLAGHPPFQGGYAEAISYAIRHDTPPPLKTLHPEIPDDVEQLVFRALHKEAGVRFQTGRELARALRHVQGHSVPVELQSGPVEAPLRAAGPAPPPGLGRRRAFRSVAAVAVVAGLAGWFVLRPPARTFVAVAPVANQTGDSTLDPYRLGLTLAMTRELGESRSVRVLSYQQLLQSLRRYLLSGEDVSSRDVVRTIGVNSGASVVIVPTLLYDSGAWRARAELQDPKTGTAVGRIEAGPIESSLTKDAASTLIAALAARVAERFAAGRWRLFGADARPVRFQSLEAAKAFEQGVNAYDEFEYAAARDAFIRASAEDPRHPLPAAWLSRVEQVAGDRNAAAEAADRALGRLENAAPTDRLFVEAVAAEARRQDATAEAKYREIASLRRDEPAWLMELAAFQDRSGRTSEAIATYHEVLALESRFVGPQLELCRLYNSTRLNEAGLARSFGEQARRGYLALGSKAGEAQALLCLADILRVGTADERAQARARADEALRIFQSLHLPYGTARAQHYVASTARAQGDLRAAAEWWERALASAQAVGNVSLEGTVFINLGVTHNALGNRFRALDYYRQSYELAERRGDERRAAYSRANAGALLIEFGGDPDEGLRFVEGALRVVQRLEDKLFEVFCLQLVAAHYRFTGNYGDAQRELGRALAIARERGFADAIPSLILDEGRVLMQMGDYAGARGAFLTALSSEGGTKAVEARIELGRVLAVLGEFEASRRALDDAKAQAETGAGDILPRLTAAFGELAYEAGQMRDAREMFEAASRMWTDEFPDVASVESRAYLGLLDGLSGQPSGRAAVEASLAKAEMMRRPALEARCRVFLARLDLQDRHASQAAAVLAAVPMEAIGPELQAQVHFWRAQALTDQGVAGGVEEERQQGRQLLRALSESVPKSSRDRFLLRPDLRAMSN